MSRLQSWLYTAFLTLFIPLMLIIAVMFVDYASEPKYYICPIVIAAILAGALFVFKKSCNKSGNKLFYPVLILLSVILFSIQFSIFKENPELTLHGDYRAMFMGFREISSYGEFTDCLEYFLAHRHQIFAAVFYGVLNRIFVMAGLTGPVSITGTIITNCVLINIGGILLSLAIKNVTNYAYGLLTMLLFFLFNSYWGCILYAYPHTLSVFFIGLMVFCFSLYAKAEKSKFKLIWLAVSGLAFALCKSSEGITLIAFIAAVIYIAISCSKPKQLVLQLGTLILSFVLSLAMISCAYDVLGVIDETERDKYEFPITHWIMMGQGETGNYCEEDYQATVSIEGKQAKFEMHKEELIKRISSRTPAETAKFWLKKQKEAWIGGTYGVRTDFPDNFAYNYSYRFILLLSVIAGAIFTFIRKIKSKTSGITFLAFSQIYLIGVFFFFCIWEVSYAYLFSSMPMLIICAVLSLYSIVEKSVNHKE